MPEDRCAGACGLACCRVRKRWGLDVPAFVGHVDSFVGYAHIIDPLAFRDTDAGPLSGATTCFGYAVSDGGACAVPDCVVLPAH